MRAGAELHRAAIHNHVAVDSGIAPQAQVAVTVDTQAANPALRRGVVQRDDEAIIVAGLLAAEVDLGGTAGPRCVKLDLAAPGRVDDGLANEARVRAAHDVDDVGRRLGEIAPHAPQVDRPALAWRIRRYAGWIEDEIGFRHARRLSPLAQVVGVHDDVAVGQADIDTAHFLGTILARRVVVATDNVAARRGFRGDLVVGQPDLQNVAAQLIEFSDVNGLALGENQLAAIAVDGETGLNNGAVVRHNDVQPGHDSPEVGGDIVAAAHPDVVGLFRHEILGAQELTVEVVDAGQAGVSHENVAPCAYRMGADWPTEPYAPEGGATASAVTATESVLPADPGGRAA